MDEGREVTDRERVDEVGLLACGDLHQAEGAEIERCFDVEANDLSFAKLLDDTPQRRRRVHPLHLIAGRGRRTRCCSNHELDRHRPGRFHIHEPNPAGSAGAPDTVDLHAAKEAKRGWEVEQPFGQETVLRVLGQAWLELA